MKKFMQTSAVAKEQAARKGERDSMLMGLNSTAGSDDVDDDPADSLAYGHMRIRKDGTVMTDLEIRELRQRQGYCLTCPGEPIKLFAVKRSKMNPLYQKKEPIEVLNQSINGVCLKCNSGNPSSVRRGSFGKPSSGGSANADMLPGTLLSLRTDPYFKQMRKVSSFGANGIGEINGSILSPTEPMGGSMNGGFGTSVTGPDQSPDQVIPLSSSQQNGAAKRRASSSKIIRSNSGDIAKVARSLTPTRLHALRRSNSDDSIVSTGINGAMRLLPPPNFSLKRSKSNDFDSSPLNFDFESLHGLSSSVLSNHVTDSDQQLELESQQASHHDQSNTHESKAPSWKEIADIAVRAKREKEGFDISKTGTVQELRLTSVDSDGFFNGVDELSSASESEFRNSFANLDSDAVAQENKRDLLTKQNSDFDANLEDAEVLRISSSEPMSTETKAGNNEAVTIRTDKESSSQDRASPGKPLNQRLPTTVANEKSIDQPDLLHYTLLRFMKMSEERFDDLERQMATVIQQQTRILQQHGTILEILCDRNPVTPGGNTAVPYFRQENGNENHPMVASTVSPPLSDGVQEIEPSPSKKVKERSKSKLVSSPVQIKDASSPAAKLEKVIIPVEPDPDESALEYNGNAVVASVTAAKVDDPTVGSYEDYEMQLGGGDDINLNDHQSVDDDTVIAANPPNLGAASPNGTSARTTTTGTTSSIGRTASRRGSGELRRSSTLKSIVDVSASSSGGGTRRDGSVPPSKVLRRKSSQKRLISAERSQGRILSISPGRRSTRANRAFSADGDEMLMMMLAASTRGATTPKRENRADSTTATPPDCEQGPNGIEHKPRRGSSRRPRGDGDELSSSRNGGLDAKQDKKKEKRKLKKRSSTSKKADFALDEDDDNNS